MPGSVLSVRLVTTLDAVRADLAAQRLLGERPILYYGARTCWWTHRAKDLRRGAHGLPVDVRGGVLLQCDEPERFLAALEEDPAFYGRHGVQAFVAAHHDNAFLTLTDRPWCAEVWEEYNGALDVAIAEGRWPR